MAFETFPYTNFHELNLDWIIDQIKRLRNVYDRVPETVAEWLEGPEGQQVLIDAYAALDDSIIAAASSEPVNVLLLGFDNTGATDVSGLINQYTKEYALYFPVGVYRIDNPVFLVNSIIGACRSTAFSDYATGHITFFESHVQGGAVFTIDGNTQRGIAIENCNIATYSTETAIQHVGPADQSFKYLAIRNVTIRIKGGIGIDISPIRHTSRACVMYGICVFGDTVHYTNIGIRINKDAPDCQLIGCYIMGVQRGIRCAGNHLQALDVHIWTGPLDPTIDSKAWWKNTYGILLENTTTDGKTIFNGSNIYLDTCHVGIALYNAVAFITGLTDIQADINGVPAEDGDAVLCYVDDRDSNNKLYVDGYYCDANARSFTNGFPFCNYNLGNKVEYNFKNITAIVPVANYGTNKMLFPTMPFCDNRQYTIIPSRYPQIEPYYEVATLYNRYGTYVEFDVVSGNNAVNVSFARGRNPYFVKTSINGDLPLYYYYDSDNYVYHIYTYQAAYEPVTVKVNYIGANSEMVQYDACRRKNTLWEYPLRHQANDNNLTEI